MINIYFSLAWSGKDWGSGLQNVTLWVIVHHLGKEQCSRVGPHHSPELLLGLTGPGLSSAFPPVCQVLADTATFKL